MTAFREQIRLSFERLPRGILAPHQLEKLSAAGVELYGLDRETAQQAIRDAAAHLKIAVVASEQAEQYVGDLVVELLGDGLLLSAAQRERVQQAGAQWGLSPTRINEIIRQRVKSSYGQRRREEAASQLALAAAGVAVLFVIGFLGYAMTGGLARSGLHRAAPEPLQDRPLSALPPTDPSLDDSWWGIHLAFAAENARQAFPELAAPLRDIAAKDVRRRQRAYDRLVEELLRRTDDAQRGLLLAVLSGCLARDPTDAGIAGAAAALLRIVPDAGANLPENPEALSTIFWGVRTVTAALNVRAIPPQRSLRLAALLSEALGFAVDSSQPPAQMEKACLAALGDRLFRMLIATAAEQIANAARLHAVVASQTAPYLDPGAVDALNAEFLVTVLGVSADSWRQYENLVRATVASAEPLAVLKLLDLYESTSDKELQVFLGSLLLERTAFSTAASNVDQVVEHVRRALGVTSAAGPGELWKRLSRDAQRTMAECTAGPEPSDRILSEVMRLAHYSTLACAMANDAWGDAAVERLYKAGPKVPAEGAPEPAAPAAIPPTDPGAATAIQRTIAQLQRRPVTMRLDALQFLARQSEQVSDLPPEQAAALASYLLTTKSGAEHERALAEIEVLAKWNQLLLAVADRLDDSLLTRDQLQGLLARLLGRSFVLGEGKADYPRVRAELWRKVLERLEYAGPARGAASRGDAVAAALFELYVQQARILGVSGPELDSAVRSPSTVLRLLIRELSTRLSGTAASDAARRELVRTAHDLTAAEYVAGNDMQLTALLERIWLRLLALDTNRRDARRAADTARLLVDLEGKDQAAGHVLTQIRDGQAAILRMWLLAGRRN